MIRFEAFRKVYGSHVAVDTLTLSVGACEVLALLGPNGSGKTTALKAAAGLLRPTSGSVLLGNEGLPAMDAVAREAISFLPQKVSFPESLTGREVVDFYRRLRGAPAAGTQAALDLASLNGAGGRPVSTYSGGMVQRLGLAVATVPDAPVLLLDEPTAALDPDGLCAFYGLVGRLRARGRTVLFTSHQMGDVERLADRVALLVAGRLVAVLSQRELQARLAARGRLRLTLEEPASGALLARVRNVTPGAHGEGLDMVVDGGPDLRPRVIEAVAAAGATIRAITTEEGRLDGLYAELVKGAAA